MNTRKIDELCRQLENTRRILPGSVNSYYGLFKLLCICMLSVYISPVHGALISALLAGLNGVQFTDAFSRRITAPSNVRENKEFDQNYFIQSVNKNKSTIIKLDEDGICYGLMMSWYLYLCLNSEAEFFLHLDKIMQAKNLNAEQKNLISKIHLLQINQGQTFVATKGEEKLKTTFEKNKSYTLDQNSFSEDLERISQHAIQYAISNLGMLVELSVSWKKNHSHAIGLVALRTNDNIEIKYFDPNFRKATCTDPFSAQHNIVNLINYAYKYSQDSWWDERLVTINLYCYSVKTFSLDDLEWQQKFTSHHLFFAKNRIGLQEYLDIEKQNGNTSAQKEWDRRWGLI